MVGKEITLLISNQRRTRLWCNDTNSPMRRDGRWNEWGRKKKNPMQVCSPVRVRPSTCFIHKAKHSKVSGRSSTMLRSSKWTHLHWQFI